MIAAYPGKLVAKSDSGVPDIIDKFLPGTLGLNLERRCDVPVLFVRATLTN